MRSCISARSEAKDVLTHYVIVRTDLPIGVVAAQIAHAAGESSPGNLAEGTHAIVLGVPDEQALRDLATRVAAAGLRFTPIFEPDAPYYGQYMAIGLAPVPRSVGRKVLSSLPLFKGSTFCGSSSEKEHRGNPEVGGSSPSSRANFASVAQRPEHPE